MERMKAEREVYSQTRQTWSRLYVSGELAEASLEGRNMADSPWGSWFIKYCKRPTWVSQQTPSRVTARVSTKFLIKS